MDASTNKIEAVISCSPWPFQGKCGVRIHKNRGIIMIRLIVMELGRFMWNAGGGKTLSAFIIALVAIQGLPGLFTFRASPPHNTPVFVSGYGLPE
jgi:hypothetical protein